MSVCTLLTKRTPQSPWTIPSGRSITCVCDLAPGLNAQSHAYSNGVGEQAHVVYVSGSSWNLDRKFVIHTSTIRAHVCRPSAVSIYPLLNEFLVPLMEKPDDEIKYFPISTLSSHNIPQCQRQRIFFFSERELKKALRDTLTRAAWLGPGNFWLVRSMDYI